jgi:hypothetical protein
MKASAKFDFEDERFNAPPSQVIPWCQMINPRYNDDGVQSHGLAVKLDNAQSVGFTPDSNWQKVEHEFTSGIETVYLSATPRVVIVRRGPLSVKDRETGVKLGTLRDNYDAFLADKLKFKTFTRYLVFLVGENQKFLHESPLQLTLHGAAGASFSKTYCEYQQGRPSGGFVIELERAYANFRQQPIMPKGALFHAHGIFCPIIESEERGIHPNIVLVASTTNYKHPTPPTLTQYLIASDSPESAIITRIFEDYKEFGKEQPRTESNGSSGNNGSNGNTGNNNKMAMAGVANSSYVYADEDDFAYPPY